MNEQTKQLKKELNMFGSSKIPYVIGGKSVMLTPAQASYLQTRQPMMSPSGQYQKEVNAKRDKVNRAVYFEFEVENATNQEQRIILFDALSAFRLQQGFNMPAGVTIRGLTKNYQLVLNKLIAGKMLVDHVQLVTDIGKENQFKHSINVYRDSPHVDDISIVKTLSPSQGVSQNQEQLHIIEMNWGGLTINGSTALDTTIVADNTLIFRMWTSEIRKD